MNAIHRRPSRGHTPLNRWSRHQQLLVSAMRKRDDGPAGLADAASDLLDLFGIYYIDSGLAAFETLLTALAESPSPVAASDPVATGGVDARELTTLKLICAFQANEWGSAKRFAGDLAAEQQLADVLNAASVIAEILDARRILFTLRDFKPLSLTPAAGQG